MLNSINPYQVSRPSDSPSGEDLRLVFDGAIGKDDYRGTAAGATGNGGCAWCSSSCWRFALPCSPA